MDSISALRELGLSLLCVQYMVIKDKINVKIFYLQCVVVHWTVQFVWNLGSQYLIWKCFASDKANGIFPAINHIIFCFPELELAKYSTTEFRNDCMINFEILFLYLEMQFYIFSKATIVGLAPAIMFCLMNISSNSTLNWAHTYQRNMHFAIISKCHDMGNILHGI